MLRRTIALLSLLTISPAWGQSAETKAAPVPQTLVDNRSPFRRAHQDGRIKP